MKRGFPPFALMQNSNGNRRSRSHRRANRNKLFHGDTSSPPLYVADVFLKSLSYLGNIAVIIQDYLRIMKNPSRLALHETVQRATYAGLSLKYNGFSSLQTLPRRNSLARHEP